jgi:hypothetical protein
MMVGFGLVSSTSVAPLAWELGIAHRAQKTENKQYFYQVI